MIFKSNFLKCIPIVGKYFSFYITNFVIHHLELFKNLNRPHFPANLSGPGYCFNFRNNYPIDNNNNGKYKNLQNVLCECLSVIYSKSEKKGRTKEEVDEIIFWLTGYNKQTLQQHIDDKTDFETFFYQAPQINPNVSKITGVICGYRIEDIEDKRMQQIRYLDKLIDELAKGKAMDKILRQ